MCEKVSFVIILLGDTKETDCKKKKKTKRNITSTEKTIIVRQLNLFNLLQHERVRHFMYEIAIRSANHTDPFFVFSNSGKFNISQRKRI